MIAPLKIGDRGFTMIELLISIAIGAIVISAIYSIYTFALRSSSGMDASLEAQLELRSGMERLVKELRASGCYYNEMPIFSAGANSIEFESDLDTSSKGPWKIRYTLSNGELSREDVEWNGAYGQYGPAQVVAGNITVLKFTYFGIVNGVDNQPMTPSIATADLLNIRRVDFSMSSAPDNPNQATGNTDTITVQTAVHLRCMGVEQTNDMNDCIMPPNTTFTSEDMGNCGSLFLTWGKATSVDVAGYRIYYKVSTGASYTGVFDVPGGNTLEKTVTGLNDGVEYEFNLKCYDTSGNLSNFIGAQSGTAGTLDTRPDDAGFPPAPTWSNIIATAGDGEVMLSWAAPTPTVVDLGGFDIYRSDDAGVSYSKVISLTSADIKYTDVVGPAMNCPADPYWYKITSWDCSGALPLDDLNTPVLAVYGDGTRTTDIDKPIDGETDTFPANNIAPPDPTEFLAVAGSNRIYLSYTTPLDNKLAGTRIIVDENISLVNADETYNSEGPSKQLDYVSLPGQTYAIEDNGKWSKSKQINIGTTYNYKAFSFDTCSNFSDGSTSQAEATPCGDGVDISAPLWGRPLAPASLSAHVCENVALSWPASVVGSETNGESSDPNLATDVVGYYIYRSDDPTKALNASPVTLTSYSDATAVPGIPYDYSVVAVDCAGKESRGTNKFPIPNIPVMPNSIRWNGGAVTLLPTEGPAGEVVAGSQQNIVQFSLKTKGNMSLVLDSANITWKKALTVGLNAVALRPDGTGFNHLFSADGPPLQPLERSASLVDFQGFQGDVTLRRIDPTSAGDDILLLEFMDMTRKPFADMRGESIDITFNYTPDNVPSSGGTCKSALINVPVSFGPQILTATQDEPNPATLSNLGPGITVVNANSDTSAGVVTVTVPINPEHRTSIVGDPKLYYTTTDRTVTVHPDTDYKDPPTRSTGTPAWTAIPLCSSAGSNSYETAGTCTASSDPIPALPGKRVWYYIRVVDSNGIVDIHPEPISGIFTYDQESRFTVDPVDISRNNNNITAQVHITDETGASVTGVTVDLTVKNLTDGTTVTLPMVEDVNNAGIYDYTGAGFGTIKNIRIDATVTATKASFTTLVCSKGKMLNIKKNATITASCNAGL